MDQSATKLLEELDIKTLLEELDIKTSYLDLKNNTVSDLTVIIQSLFYGSYPPEWSYQYADENQKILDHWSTLSIKKKTLFVRVAIVAADLLFYEDNEALEYYQRLYLDILQHPLAVRPPNKKALSGDEQIISTRLRACFEKIQAHQEADEDDFQKSIDANIAYTYLELTLPDRKPDIPHFYLRCSTIFESLTNHTDAEPKKAILSLLSQIYSYLHHSHLKNKKRNNDTIDTNDLQKALKNVPAIAQAPLYIKCFLAATYYRTPMLKVDFGLNEESSKAIAGFITHLITTYTEGYDIGISTDDFAKLIYAIQMHCYEESSFSPEQFQKIEQKKVPSPEFLASASVFNAVSDNYNAASDDYFFHWMASFISNEPQTDFQFSKTSKDRFDREYTTAAYFALSQIQRRGTGNAPDARLYFSIHHTYHSFREQGTAPRQDLWLLAWTKHLLKDAPSTLAENFFLKFQFLSPENLNRSLTLPEAIQSDTVTELYRLYPDKFAHVSHLTITGQNADFIKETLHLFPHLTHLTCQNCKLENLDTIPLTLSSPLLQKIQLKACGLKKVPQLTIQNCLLDTLLHPLEIDLSDNRISDIDSKALNFPPEVTLILENNAIPKERLIQLQRIYEEENYYGPKIITNYNDSPDYPLFNLSGHAKEFTRCTGIKFDILESLSTYISSDNVPHLEGWLNKILYFLKEQNAKYRNHLSKKIIKFIEKIISEKKQNISIDKNSFTQQFFSQIVAHNNTCTDAAHISILNLDFLFAIKTQSNNPEQVLKQFISWYVLNKLRSFDKKSVDPIETYANLLPLVLKELKIVSSVEIDFKNLSGIITPVDHKDVVDAILKLLKPWEEAEVSGKKSATKLRSDWMDELFVDGRQVYPFLKDLLLENESDSDKIVNRNDAILLNKIESAYYSSPDGDREEFSSVVKAYVSSNNENGRIDLTTLLKIEEATLHQDEDLDSFIDKVWGNIYSENTVETDEKFNACWIRLIKKFIGPETLEKYKTEYESLLQKCEADRSKHTHDWKNWMRIDSYPVLDATISPLFSSLLEHLSSDVPHHQQERAMEELRKSLPHYFIQTILFIGQRKHAIPKMLEKLHDRYSSTIPKNYDAQDVQKLDTEANYQTLITEWQCAPYLLNALFPISLTRDSSNSDVTKIHKFLNSVFLLFSHYRDAKKSCELEHFDQLQSEIFDKVFNKFFPTVAVQYVLLTGCYLTVARFQESIEIDWNAFPDNIFGCLEEISKEELDFNGAFNTIQAFEGHCTLQDDVKLLPKDLEVLDEAFKTFQSFRERYGPEDDLNDKIKSEENSNVREAFNTIERVTARHFFPDENIFFMETTMSKEGELPSNWKQKLNKCSELLEGPKHFRTKMSQKRFQALTNDWKLAQETYSDLLTKLEPFHALTKELLEGLQCQ